MAVTKIWAIKDSLSRVVDYAANPSKRLFTMQKTKARLLMRMKKSVMLQV